MQQRFTDKLRDAETRTKIADILPRPQVFTNTLTSVTTTVHGGLQHRVIQELERCGASYEFDDDTGLTTIRFKKSFATLNPVLFIDATLVLVCIVLCWYVYSIVKN